MTPGEVTLFVDRSAGAVTVPGVLREAGFQVALHDEHFPVETPDHVWIAEVAGRGWFAVTLDHRIYYSPISKAAALQSRYFGILADDPRLPVGLLPPDWLGDKAAQLFKKLKSLLTVSRS